MISDHWKRVTSFVFDHAPIDPEDRKSGMERREERRTLDRHESFRETLQIWLSKLLIGCCMPKNN